MISLYQKVTNQIVAQLKAGTISWVKPWSATHGRNVPCNAVTNRAYSGINTLLLWQVLNHGYTSPRFLTFRQANVLGGRVKRGQNGFKVYFVKRMKKIQDEDIDDTKEQSYTLLKEYTVFNIDQCEGLPEEIVNPKTKEILNKDQRHELADEFVRHTKADVRPGGSRAFYSTRDDYIGLPGWETFSNRDTYYATLFHELTHWTGHRDRQARDLRNRFGSRAYAAEELVAELGSSFLCAEFGFDNHLRSADYIANWLTLLHNDNRAVFTAASKASAAATFLRELALREWPSKSQPANTDSLSTPLVPVPSRWATNTSSTGMTADHPEMKATSFH